MTTDFKVYIAQIIIGIIGVVHLILQGDGEIVRLIVMAEGILGGVDIVAERLTK